MKRAVKVKKGRSRKSTTASRRPTKTSAAGTNCSGKCGHKWYGYAGHLITGKSCAYHLATLVGGRYLISTVGHYLPRGESGPMQTIGAGDKAFFETYVFACDGEDKYGNPNVLDWGEVDGERYATSREAEAGHYRYIEKYEQIL